MEIEIPFNDWSKQRLKAGVKLATTRSKKYGVIGDTFKVEHRGNVYNFELMAVHKTQLYIVTRDFYYLEGASSEHEFVNVWKDIHKKAGYQPYKEVYIHFFKLKV